MLLAALHEESVFACRQLTEITLFCCSGGRVVAQHGNTALLEAVRANHVWAVEVLLQRGADQGINLQDKVREAR